MLGFVLASTLSSSFFLLSLSSNMDDGLVDCALTECNMDSWLLDMDYGNWIMEHGFMDNGSWFLYSWIMDFFLGFWSVFLLTDQRREVDDGVSLAAHSSPKKVMISCYVGGASGQWF